MANKLEVEEHNKRYQRNIEIKLAYEIMNAEGLQVRDIEVVRKKRAVARNNLAMLAIASIGMGLIGR